MTALPYYSTGTVSITGGGTVVTGSITVWSGVNARPGDILQVGNFQTVISDVTDTTHLAIPPWGGGSVSGASYKIFHTSPQRFAGAQAMADVSSLISLMNSAPIFGGTGDTTFVTGASTNVIVGQNSDAPTYNLITLNGDLTDAGYMGMTGGAGGDDTLYLQSPGDIQLDPIGGNVDVNGTINDVTLDNTAWTNTNVTLSSVTGTITSITSAVVRWKKIGKTVWWEFNFEINNNGTGSNALRVLNMPFTPLYKAAANGYLPQLGLGLNGYITDGTTILTFFDSTGAYPGATSRYGVISGHCQVA